MDKIQELKVKAFDCIKKIEELVADEKVKAYAVALAELQKLNAERIKLENEAPAEAVPEVVSEPVTAETEATEAPVDAQ